LIGSDVTSTSVDGCSNEIRTVAVKAGADKIEQETDEMEGKNEKE